MTMLSHDCRVSLFRIIWESGEGSVEAFALESTRDAARRFFEAAIALIAGRAADDLELYDRSSCTIGHVDTLIYLLAGR